VSSFTSVKVVGDLLPSSLLDRIFAADTQLPGTSPASYGLESGESIRRQASRSWLYLVDVWQEYQRRLTAGDPAGGDAASARATRERWLLILLRELGFGQLPADGSVDLDGRVFPVSHRSGTVPVHLLGWGTDLDHKTPKVTARAPQSMLQELLNRDDARLWAILSNGSTLRLLRDSAALVGTAYVEFDLAAIFDGELFSDFVLLYLVCHQTRFAEHEDGGPQSCYLEQWRGFAADQGERALDQLRVGVERAIAVLGTGFISHQGNPQLRARLDPDKADLRLDDLNRALLRLVYRILFWFVAEDRGALLAPDPDGASQDELARLRQARERYDGYFSAARLRRLARRQRGSRHTDLWESVQLVFDGLGTEGGIPELALPGIGGIFESRRDDGSALPLDEPLAGARIANEALLDAVRALSIVRVHGGSLQRVDFDHLGAEELGSVYESLLERIPHYDPDTLAYTLDVLPGNERKESGSYYTPTSLVECLLDSALDPLLDEASSKPTPGERVEALLAITVCDPACGSGHFLVAAARRIAKRVAAEETSEPEPPVTAVRAALRRVTGRCIYGVDVNPMAAELARVALCLEALEPGKPLTFLDENIRVGNALLGSTPALLEARLPDDAFKPIEGDDRKVAAALRKQNAAEKAGQGDLFSTGSIPVTNAVLSKQAAQIARVLPDNLEDVHIHQQRQARELASSPERCQQKLLADAWCAAFIQVKNDDTRRSAITQATLAGLAGEDRSAELAAAESVTEQLTRQYRFFHWHVEFPHIFRVGDGTTGTEPATGWAGGFSCVIGNPPWERVKLQEQEFFAARSPEIAGAANAAARKKKIAALADSASPADRMLHAEFQAELRKSSGWSHLLRQSGRFPLTGRGDVNTYAVFAETGRTIIGPQGRSGMVLPTGIATDMTTSMFCRDLVAKNNISSFYAFENEEKIFKDVNNRPTFCLLTILGHAGRNWKISMAARLRSVRNIREMAYQLSVDDVHRINPNSGTLPVFRTAHDSKITAEIYMRIPVLWRDAPSINPWGLSFLAMYHMANDSGQFRTREQLEMDGWKLTGNVFIIGTERMLPLYEGKMIHHFDSRFATYEGATREQVNKGTLPRLTAGQHADPEFFPEPRYWVQEFDTVDEAKSTPEKTVCSAVGVSSRLAARNWDRGWLLGWRDICRSTDERTVICGVLPRTAVGHTFPLMLLTSKFADCLLANLSAMVFDYVSRQKLAGTHLTYSYLNQLPALAPSAYDVPATWSPDSKLVDWIRPRALELSYTAWDMTAFAQDLGDDGPPFRWDEGRRAVMRAELDAAYFHLYGLERGEVEHVMDSFDALRRREEKAQNFGEFRTKRLILERCDAMADAIRTGVAYQTPLDPPPGHGPRHPDRASGQPRGSHG
jgi:hypothetical protein